MAEVFFDNPPVLTGKEDNQLRQLSGYLHAMSEKLNSALMTISIEQMEPETRQVITRTEQKTEKNYDTLKSMIIKTAEIVRHEMDEIRIHLEDNYEAISSQFGEYEQNLTQEITLTAKGVLQEFEIVEKIQGLESGTDEFQNRIDQYIFSGEIFNGKFGIAIGQNVTGKDANGNRILNGANKTATFTMDELAFWHGETKLAYFTDSVFHINNGEITKTLKIGNHTWQSMTGGAMALISG